MLENKLDKKKNTEFIVREKLNNFKLSVIVRNLIRKSVIVRKSDRCGYEFNPHLTLN